jgi:hypothetical protein
MALARPIKIVMSLAFPDVLPETKLVPPNIATFSRS